MIAAIEAALQHDVAGDPITGIRWTRRTTEKIATELATLDIQVCPRTVGQLVGLRKRPENLLVDLVADVGFALEGYHVGKARVRRDG